MTDDIINHIHTLSDNGLIEDAIGELSELLSQYPENAKLNFLMGKLLWKAGKRSDAMSFYLKAEKLDPTGPARRAIEMSRDIDSYFNPDLLNP